MLRTFSAICALGLLFASPASAVLVYQQLGPDDQAPAKIVAAHDDGTSPEVIASGFDPYVAPTGRRVAYFTRVGASMDLHVVGRSGRHRRRVAEFVYDRGSTAPIAWNRDGRYLVVAASAGGAYLIDLRQRTRRYLDLDEDFTGASFRPDGTRFALGDSGDDDLFAVRVPSRRRSRIAGDAHVPVWGSPGLAFARGAFPGEKKRIVLRKPDGVRVRLLSERVSHLAPLAWSDDGRRLLAAEVKSSKTTSPHRALLIDPETRAVTRLGLDFRDVWGLSHDGREVLAETTDHHVVSAAADGTTATLAADATHPSWTK